MVEAARQGEPQLVTKRGAPAVVVLAAAGFVDHLLAMPGDDEPFERLDVEPRNAGFRPPAR